MMRILFQAATAVVFLWVAVSASAADRPNILWITSEDNSPYLRCYGDALAETPHLDRLAAEGVRYRNAFSSAPVCSTARSTLITGMHASTLGVQHHRSQVAIPPQFLLYPEHLRAAGYYCTNQVKTDYNVAGRTGVWDESSKKAHYRGRRDGQPFFAVFNFTTSHESQVAPKAGKTSFRVPPEKIPLPPYHPDTPELRRDWANYYDQMTLMDAQAGKVLAELAEAGLAEETIVFYYGDHGGALPRGKRNIHDSGTRVPLIVRIPEKWAAWRPAAPGGWVEDPVCFTDFAATTFSLCGVTLPKHYQGRAFLGPDKVAPRDHVFLFRGRMDERSDTVRAVRDRQYRYVRNYSPHRPWGQHYSYPFQVQPSMRSWFAAYQAGRCNEVQSAYWQPKPPVELYAIASDPFEIKNLAPDPAHADRLREMDAILNGEMISSRDTGFIPEGMFERLAGDKTIYDYAQSDAYPIERIVKLAGLATSREAATLPEMLKAMQDPHPVIRYWGVTGCLVLQEKAKPAATALKARLQDEYADVRVVAAEALAWTGEAESAQAALQEVITAGRPYETLAALNALDALVQAGRIPKDQAQALVRPLQFKEPADRIRNHLLTPLSSL